MISEPQAAVSPIAKVVQHICEVPEQAWQALHDDAATPFMSWAFLEAMERTGCVSPEQGWLPVHLTLWRGERLIAAAPAYIKSDSMGDFSRDWGWTGAFQRARLPYYPKMVLGVPFTPVQGRRFLVHPDEDWQTCVLALAQLAWAMAQENELSSVQVLYCLESEREVLELAGFAPRVSFQFHWFNKEYANREAFLSTLKSKRRTQLRREWRTPLEQGVDIRTLREAELRSDPERWSRLTYQLYKQTVERYMWRTPYLSEQFYLQIFERMPQHLELVIARDVLGRTLAGAFNVAQGQTLWGRYWGAFEELPFLHFNVCFYHTIDACIGRGVKVFEGGEGGQHKLQRGFEPAFTHHAFRFTHPAMDAALQRYLREEKLAREAEIKRFCDGD